MRAHETANVLGDAFTSVYLNASVPPEDRNSIIFYPWTAPPFLNAATNQSFASWEELSQNYTQNGDLFSITVRFVPAFSHTDFADLSYSCETT